MQRAEETKKKAFEEESGKEVSGAASTVPCCFRGRALRLKTRRGYRPGAACYGFEEKAASLVLVGLSLPPRSIYPTRDFFAGASGRVHEQQQQCWFQTQTGARVVVRASGGPWTTQAGRHVRSGQQSASASGVCMAEPVALHLPLPLPPGQDRTGLGSSLWGLCQCQTCSRSGSLLCLLATAARPDRSPSGPPRFTRSRLHEELQYLFYIRVCWVF